MGEGAGVQVGVDLLDDGMVAVLAFGLDQFDRRVGEHGVIPPCGEQLVLSLGGLVVFRADPPDDQPGGDLLFFGFDVNAAYSVSATSASETQQAAGRPRGPAGTRSRPRVVGDGAIAAWMLEFIGTVTEKYALLRRIVPITAAL